MTSKFETIRKLRALQNSPYPEEAEAARRKADALESSFKYEDWMLELSEMLHKNFPEKHADEMLNLLIEKYYQDGYVGNFKYQEYMKDGVGRYCKEQYEPKYEPITSDDEEPTEDEKYCYGVLVDTMKIVSRFSHQSCE